MGVNFQYNTETLGLISRPNYGKSKIIKEILKKIPKEKILVLDTNLEYEGYNRAIPKAYNRKILERFILEARKMKNIVIVLEDIDVYLQGISPENFMTLLFNGRHQNIGIIYTAHRPVNFSKSLLSGTNHLFVGGLQLKDDIALIPMNEKEKILTLGLHEFLYKDPSGNEQFFSL